MLSAGVAILLPLLVSGFLFAIIFFPTRFLGAQFEGQRLFFMCAACGLAISLAASFTYPVFRDCLLVAWPSGPARLSPILRTVLPGEHPGVLAFMLMFGPSVAALLNLPMWVKPPKRLSIRFWQGWSLRIGRGWDAAVQLMVPFLGEPMQQFIIRAAMHQKPIQISMKSGRVYIGVLHRAPRRPHAGLAHIELITWYSLFRDEKTGKFPPMEQWSTYPSGKVAQARAFLSGITEAVGDPEGQGAQQALAAKVKAAVDELTKSLPQISPEDWVRLIPISEVESIAHFDRDVYDWFVRSSEPATPVQPPAAGLTG